jgi:hypothetical protein
MKPHCCKISYGILLKMKRSSDWAHDLYWSLELYDLAYRYTRISQRILEAIARIPIENLLKG